VGISYFKYLEVVVLGMGVVAAVVVDLVVVVVPQEVMGQKVALDFIACAHASCMLQVTRYKLHVTSYKL
jgi:hypothetical protein